MVPAHGVTTLFYLIGRARGAAAARRTLAGVIGVFGVAAVDESVIRRAVALEWPDLEDAVCAAAAEASGCDGFALFYLKGIAPKEIKIQSIYLGIIPFVILQVIALATVMAWPNVALWLMRGAYGD
jgi:hypothetical protein